MCRGRSAGAGDPAKRELAASKLTWEAIIANFRIPLLGRRWLELALGIGMAGLFLHLALRNVDMAEAMAAFSGIDSRHIAPIVAMSFVVLWLRVWRWKSMFSSGTRPSGRSAFHAFVLGAFGNCVLPGRLGDLMRAGLIARDIPAMGISGALATVVLEKVMDGLAVLVLLALALWFAPLPVWLVQAGLVTAAVFLFALALLFVMARRVTKQVGPRKPGLAGLSRRRPIAVLYRLAHKFTVGLEVVTSIRQLVVLLLFSVLIWSAESLIVYLSFQLFDIGLPPVAALVTIVYLTVGTMLPAAPGFIGTYQFFVISALALYGVAESAGLALSIFMNLFAIGMASVFAAGALLVQLLPATRHRPAQG